MTGISRKVFHYLLRGRAAALSKCAKPLLVCDTTLAVDFLAPEDDPRETWKVETTPSMIFHFLPGRDPMSGGHF